MNQLKKIFVNNDSSLVTVSAGNPISDPQAKWEYGTSEDLINQKFAVKEAEIDDKIEEQDELISGYDQRINLLQNDMIELGDKAYDASTYSGLGRKLLKKKASGVNTLYQEDINDANTIYVIQYDYVLGENITVPSNCILDFEGGSISGNGTNKDTITGNNTTINAEIVKIFNTNITLSGIWNVDRAYPEWFGAKGDGITDDSNAIQSIANSFNKTIICKEYNLNNNAITYNNKHIIVSNGKLINGTINASSKLTIKGYGILCILQNSDNIIFENPYCVSYVNSRNLTDIDGSPQKPFLYLLDALDVCNNILIKRDSVFWIDNILHTRLTYNNSMSNGVLKYNTTIDVYGFGNNPVFTGFCRTNRTATISHEEYEEYKITKFSNLFTSLEIPTYYNINRSVIDVSTHNKFFKNAGLLCDVQTMSSLNSYGTLVKDRTNAQNFLNSNNINMCHYYTGEIDGDRDSDTVSFFDDMEILSKTNYVNNTYGISYISAWSVGIDANGKFLNISNCNFEYLGFGIAGVSSIVCKNCNFKYIGGHVQHTGYNNTNWACFGNAIESYKTNFDYSAYPLHIYNCNFDQIYDAAITLLGLNLSGKKDKINISNNIISNARMGLEFFNTNPKSDSLYITINDNTFRNCRMGGSYHWVLHYNVTKQQAALRFGNDVSRLKFIIKNNNFICSPYITSSMNYNNLNDCITILRNNYFFYEENDNTVDTEDRNNFKINISNRKDIENNMFSIGTLSLENHIIVNVPKYVYSTIPTDAENNYIGKMIFDSSNNIPLYWTGSIWVDAMGNSTQ